MKDSDTTGPGREAPPLTPEENAGLGKAARQHPLTVEESAALGKAARQRLPREALSAWDPPAGRPDPLALLEAQAAARIPELIPIRYGRMLASPLAFFRGATAIMASDLSFTTNSGLGVQLCGDAHLGNFGGFASPERELVFDINDFDETLPGPWEWDVRRLAASIEIAGRVRGFPEGKRRAMLLSALGEYRGAMREFAAQSTLDVWYTLLDPARIRQRWGAAGPFKEVGKLAAGAPSPQDNQHAVEKLTRRVAGRLRIASHPPLVVPLDELLPGEAGRQAGQALDSLLRAYQKSLPDDRRRLLEQFQTADVARKVVGIGSLGLRCWIVLLAGRGADDLLFLQYKEAQASVLEPYLGKSRYAEHGKRVVEGQHLMQAASDIFLGWERAGAELDGAPHDFYVRQLYDWKLSVNLESISYTELSIYTQMCAWTLARAHARTGDRVAIAAYLGKSDRFERALAGFAAAYAAQNRRDYQALVEAVNAGRVKAMEGI
jgi:uncharacterized protein (DUF2252 family)